MRTVLMLMSKNKYHSVTASRTRQPIRLVAIT